MLRDLPNESMRLNFFILLSLLLASINLHKIVDHEHVNDAKNVHRHSGILVLRVGLHGNMPAVLGTFLLLGLAEF